MPGDFGEAGFSHELCQLRRRQRPVGGPADSDLPGVLCGDELEVLQVVAFAVFVPVPQLEGDRLAVVCLRDLGRCRRGSGLTRLGIGPDSDHQQSVVSEYPSHAEECRPEILPEE